VPSSDDRRAAVLLLLLAAAGLIVRFWQAPGQAPGAVAYRAHAARPQQDSVAARAQRLARPLASGERVDLDRAPAEELARLPRIGPALAARIVQDREEHGPFGSLEALDRVPGVGPTVLRALRPHAAFSGSRQGPAAAGSPEGSPLIGPPAPPAGRTGPRGGSQVGTRGDLDLNTASPAELEALPGIGPALAKAIVAERAAGGPFRSLEDLRRRVRGVGPRVLEALRGRVAAP
jgi:competence protein ComEA